MFGGPARRHFTWLITAIAAAALAGCGSDDSTGEPTDEEAVIPADAVAVVADADVEQATVSRADFDDAMAEGAKLLGLPKVPPADDTTYAAIRDQAMQPLLLPIWVEAESAERGIEVTEDEVRQEFEVQQQQAGIKTPADLEKVLRQRELTEAEVLEDIEAQLLQEALLANAVPSESELPEADPESIEFEEFQDEFFDKWRGRTACVPEAASELCANGPDPPYSEEAPGAEGESDSGVPLPLPGS